MLFTPRPALVERPAPELAGPAAAGAGRGAPEEAALVVVARCGRRWSLHRLSTFQTVSTPLAGVPGSGLVPGLSLSNEVPPTLVTHGCDDGSPTLTTVVPSERTHPNAPVSPEELNRLCPCIAICSKRVFSAST